MQYNPIQATYCGVYNYHQLLQTSRAKHFGVTLESN